MLLTACCVAVVLGSLLAAGLPVCWLLNGRRPLTPSDHVRAPFLGLAVIVLILQNLVYLDVPLKQSAPFLWAGLLALWLWLYRSGQLGACLQSCPRAVLAAALLVYLVQGISLFRLGASAYVGRAHTDQYNYTCLAQFLMDEPYDTRPEDLGKRPYLIPAMVIKDDRIGQSVLHGFLAASCVEDARTLFEPTSLLSPALLVLAVFALGRRLGLRPGYALGTGVVAGLLPAVTVIHLESFLSQALALPLLVFWFVLVDELAEEPCGRRLAAPALVLTAALGIYTELWPVLLGSALLILGLAVRGLSRSGRLLACFGVLAAAPFLLNLGFIPTLWKIMRRLDAPLFPEIYPFAFQLEGLGRLWLGDLAAAPPGLRQGMARLVALVVTFLGYYGLVRLGVTRLTGRGGGPEPGENRSAGVALALLAVALLPALVLARDDQHPYQFYKLLLTVTPLLLLGLATLAPPVWAVARSGWRTALPGLLVLGPLLGMALAGTSDMVLKSRWLQPLPRSLSHILLASDMRDLADHLEHLHGEPLLIASTEPTLDGPHNSWRSAWLTYFARHNPVWVTDPEVNVIDPARAPGAEKTVSATGFPERLLILANRRNGFLAAPPAGATLAWSNGSYQMWRTSSRDWAVPVNLVNPDGWGEEHGQPFFWLGPDRATLFVVAGRPGAVTLQARFRPGPDLAGTALPVLCVESGHGRRRELVIRAGSGAVTVDVAEGVNRIALAAPEEPARQSGGASRLRKHILGVQGLSLRFRPGPAQPAGL
jgi:hypothetical protein